MKTKILLSLVGIASLFLFVYAGNSSQDIPPNIPKDHWIEISTGFGLYINDASVKTLQLQKEKKYIVSENIDMNSLNGIFMVKKDGNWYRINIISEKPRVVPLNSN